MFLEVDVMAGATELDMEAAEQLIQLSGCCSGGGESESRSTDSVSKNKRCKKAAVGRKEGDKEAAAVKSCSRKRAAAGEEAGDIDEVVIGGEARRRPRFRSLAAVYRETRRSTDDGVVVVGCGRGGAPEEDGERATTKKRPAMEDDMQKTKNILSRDENTFPPKRDMYVARAKDQEMLAHGHY